MILDSYQSQANRAEAVLKRRARELRLPEIVVVIPISSQDRRERISSLDAPHRSRDAYFLDSELNGAPFDETAVGRALLGTTSSNNATAFLRYAPYDLVYVVWDSHRGCRTPLRFPRAYTAEMIGWEVLPGARAATKGDPLNLAKETVDRHDWRPSGTTQQRKKEQTDLSELGHGQVPTAPNPEAGGVSVRSIQRDAILSLTSLARYSFPIDDGDVTVEGRTCLATLGLLADRIAFAGAGLHLRSGGSVRSQTTGPLLASRSPATWRGLLVDCPHCGSGETSRRKPRTTLGYPRLRCRACGPAPRSTISSTRRISSCSPYSGACGTSSASGTWPNCSSSGATR